MLLNAALQTGRERRAHRSLNLRGRKRIRLRRCRVRLAVAQVRLSGEQVVQGCLHGGVVQVGVVEREVRWVCQASPSRGEGDVQTPRANVSARLGFHAGFSGLLTELLDVGPGEGFGLRLRLGRQLRRFR